MQSLSFVCSHTIGHAMALMLTCSLFAARPCSPLWALEKIDSAGHCVQPASGVLYWTEDEAPDGRALDERDQRSDKTHLKKFKYMMQQNGRTVIKSRRTSWGDEAAKRRHFPFDLKRFNPGFLEALVLKLTNEERANQGLPPCRYHRTLNECARQHSEEMARLDYFSHESPVPEYLSLQRRICEVYQITCTGCSENIGLQSKTGDALLAQLTYEELAREVMALWMNSSGHRSAILNPDHTLLGVGCALVVEAGTAHFYYTQDFVRE